MSAEDWLRERGIEPQKKPAGSHGDIAGQLTGALPDMPIGQPPIDSYDTQRIPALPHTPPEPVPSHDITTMPTSRLTKEPARPLEEQATEKIELPPNIHIVKVAIDMDEDTGIDFWPTEVLPIVGTTPEADDITRAPTRRLGP